MNRIAIQIGITAASVAMAATFMSQPSRAAAQESFGNTVGHLTWNLGQLEPGKSCRRTVLFAFSDSYKGLLEQVEKTRSELKAFAKHATAESASSDKVAVQPAKVTWIGNGVTDFGMNHTGAFFWEGPRRQSLACPSGGQLSRFGYYLHYNDGKARRAGTLIALEQTENLRLLNPVTTSDGKTAAGSVETADGKLRVEIRAAIGKAADAAVEFVVTNTSDKTLNEVRLSAYANIEAEHSPANDFSMLDKKIGGLLFVDLAKTSVVAMCGLQEPQSGFAGTWPSQEQLTKAAGVARAKWSDFTGLSATLTKRTKWMNRGAIPKPPSLVNALPEPVTRNLSPDEAEAVLRRDWLFQADGRPTRERTASEIGWARELAARLKKNPKTRDLSTELAELVALEKRLASVAAGKTTEAVYLDVRRVKRRIMFANPAINFSKVLFIDNPYPNGHEWPHQARHRNGMMAVGGGRLLVLDGLHPGGRVTKLAPEKPAAFWRPDLSYDAQRVLFCCKPADEESFHLYEINIDGSGLRQLTFGEYDDTDPIYLPDGRIMFTTSRANTYVRCMPHTYSYILARCDADGKNIYLISRNNEPDWCPSLLHDGRVIYSRWEYHDKALWRIQSLWATNPDGTNTMVFWGNQSVWPDHLAEPRAIPGSNRVMFTGLAHHNWFAGSIGIIDTDKGRNFPHGLTKVTRDVDWPECGRPPLDPGEAEDYHPSGKFTAYKTPYPLSEEDFLVSARVGGRDGNFRLFLMDIHGNRELIYKGHYNVWHAMPVAARPRPHRRPDAVTWPGTGKDRRPAKPGVLYSADVYQGVPDLPRGIVKHLRVIQMDARTYSTWQRDGRFSGPVVSVVQDDGVKRILGTVPVEQDGSVSFEVPAGRALHFQLLDEQFRAVHTMRSFSGVMPGERRGCVGCHESHSVSPPLHTGLALRAAPKKLIPPPWGTKSISYEAMVQPVLDKYCGKCHQGEGEARKDFDLTLRPGKGVFKEPYLSLVGYAQYNRVGIEKNADGKATGIAGAMFVENFPQSDPKSYLTFRPMQYLSRNSRLIEMASSGKHYDVKVDLESLRQLIGWVDAICPYRGDEDICNIPDPIFPGVDSLPVRPRTKTAPRIPRP